MQMEKEELVQEAEVVLQQLPEVDLIWLPMEVEGEQEEE